MNSHVGTEHLRSKVPTKLFRRSLSDPLHPTIYGVWAEIGKSSQTRDAGWNGAVFQWAPPAGRGLGPGGRGLIQSTSSRFREFPSSGLIAVAVRGSDGTIGEDDATGSEGAECGGAEGVVSGHAPGQVSRQHADLLYTVCNNRHGVLLRTAHQPPTLCLLTHWGDICRIKNVLCRK